MQSCISGDDGQSKYMHERVVGEHVKSKTRERRREHGWTYSVYCAQRRSNEQKKEKRRKAKREIKKECSSGRGDETHYACLSGGRHYFTYIAKRSPVARLATALLTLGCNMYGGRWLLPIFAARSKRIAARWPI